MFMPVALAVALLAVVLVGVTVLAIFIVTDTPEAMDPGANGLRFGRITKAASADLPEPDAIMMRDGYRLQTRVYGSLSKVRRTIILVHGSAWHGAYFDAMARAILELPGTAVLVPDLRGHGAQPGRRGDIDYIGQLEDDLADLIAFARQHQPDTEVVLAGHSSGGGLAVRFAGGPLGQLADRYALFAPYLGHEAPTTRPNSGGWAYPAIRRIVGLTLLNAFGIRAFNGLPVIAFALPVTVLSSPAGAQATPRYSYRLSVSFAPRNFAHDLERIDRPVLTLVGEMDEAFLSDQYAPILRHYVTRSETLRIPIAGHLDIVTNPTAISTFKSWLADTQVTRPQTGKPAPQPMTT